MSDNPEPFRPDGFGRKVGPLPIWAWALILAVGVYIFYRFYQNRAGSAASSAAGTVSTGYATNGSNASATPYAGISTGGTASQTFYSNDAYNQAAVGEAAQFGSTPLAVQSALQKYENSQDLTPTEGGLVNQIIGSLGGLPSSPVGTSQIVTPPTQTPQQVQAAGILDAVFGGNFTDQTAQMGGNTASSRQTAINTWANRLASGETAGQAIAQIESGPTYQNYVKSGGK